MLLRDLVRQAAQARGIDRRRRFRIRRIARPTYPTASAVVYAGRLERPVADLVELVERHVIANAGGIAASAAVTRQHDEYGHTLEDIIKYVGQEFANKWPQSELERIARDTALNLSEINRRQLTRILSNAMGVPVFFRDGWAAPEINTWATTNAKLITSIAEQHLGDVRQLVTSTIRSGSTVQEITKVMQNRYAEDLAGKPKNRAELIARDQVGKFYGNANQLRQRELGVERYVWRGVLDERERESHREKEGKVFRWDSPPADTGHPGEDYQCRCTAEPYLADVIPTEIKGREEIMRDIAKQQESLRHRQPAVIPPVAAIPKAIPRPAPVRKTARAVEETPEEIAESVFGKTTIEGGVAKKRATLAEAIQVIARELGKKSPRTLLPNIVFTSGKSYDGCVERNRFTGELLKIKITTAGEKSHAFYLAHEVGHVIDARDATRKGFPRSWVSEIVGDQASPAMRKVLTAIDESPEVGWIWRKRDETGNVLPISTKQRQYLLSGHELFARAFAQYMAIETKNESMLAGLEEYRKYKAMQWSDKNFQPIREAINEYLGERK